MREPVRVVFVCSGNICRSPTAEAVFVRQAEASGRGRAVTVASAGTGGWHVGDDMDRRSRATLEAAGYDWPRHHARQFTAADFDDYDLVIALDSGHIDELGPVESTPAAGDQEVRMVALVTNRPSRSARWTYESIEI